MKRFKKVYAIITIILGIVLSIVSIIFISINNDSTIATFENRPNKDDYNLLKHYSIIYAKTHDKELIEDENVTISGTIEDNKFVVTAEDSIAKVIATYPIQVNANNEEEYSIKIFYEKGEYFESSKLDSKFVVVCRYILIFLYLTTLIPIITYYPIILVVTIISRRIKKQN